MPEPRLKIYYLLFVCTLLMLFTPKLSFASETKNVLYLNSYNIGYDWAEDISLSISEVFAEQESFQLYTEFLDSRRLPDSLHSDDFINFLEKKYQNKEFDVIITSDNNAMDFLLKHYNIPLFYQKPTIFCGISNVDDYHFPKNFYGVKEDVYFEHQVSIILKLFPKTEVIYICLENSVTGKIYRHDLEFMGEMLSDFCRIDFLDAYDENTIAQDLDTLNRSGCIIYTTIHTDKNGEPVNSFTATEKLLKYSPIPVIGDPYGKNRSGMFGGALKQAKIHGAQAAKLAIAVLNNDTTSLPHDKSYIELPTLYAFDYNVMQRFGVKQSKLPENSVIFNKPENAFESHHVEFTIIGIFLTILITIIIFLSINISRRKSAERIIDKQIKEIEKKNLEINQSLIQVKDSNLKLAYLNSELQTANQQLSEAKRKAESANFLKSKFLFSISNKIKNPVENIRGYAKILLKGKLETTDGVKYSSFIEQETHYLLEYTEFLLEYSRLETGQEIVDNDTFSFLPAINRLLKKLKPEMDACMNSIKLVNQMESGDDVVYLDARILTRILYIIIHHINKRSRNLHVELHINRENLSQFAITFINKHTQMDPESLKQIFDPFLINADVDETKLKGMALPLSIVKNYVELLGGMVQTDAIPEHGLQFKIILPFTYKGTTDLSTQL